MIAVLLGASAAALLLWSAHRSFGASFRLRGLSLNEIQSPRVPASRTMPLAMLAKLGQSTRSAALLGSVAQDRSVSVSIGLVVVLCPAMFVVAPVVALVAGVSTIGGAVAWAHRARVRRERVVERQMPVVVELLVLAMQGGLNVLLAFSFVTKRIDGPVRFIFDEILLDVSHGMRFVDALQRSAGRLGPTGDALVSILVSGERYGSPLQDTLAQLSKESRFDQERRADAAARRLSVQLLFPVAGCMLPAFALLTIAPLLAGSLGTLASSFH